MIENDFDKASGAAERLERLSRPQTAQAYNPRYSRFIRWMRLVLPLVALAIATVVFAWSNMNDDNIIPVQNAEAPRSIGKNELLNPRFESKDDKKQPYTITASRALQGETNEDLVILEEPLADIMLNNGSWVAIKAEQGAFRQDNQRLLLRGSVELFHDKGYQIQTAQLHVDMDKNTAWSETEVYGQGPAGTLEAKGLQADSTEGYLKFTGPAKLVLNRTVTGANIGGLFDE